MELSVEQRQQVRQPVVSPQPSPHQRAPRISDWAQWLVEPAAPAYSFSAECECPGDCLRDHENE